MKDSAKMSNAKAEKGKKMTVAVTKSQPPLNMPKLIKYMAFMKGDRLFVTTIYLPKDKDVFKEKSMY